ncbi:HEPN domain-containing protein [Hydrogenovibrio kuenenii]|uniref:HEPN domain-containing protein n=1 Tax=Hydrogenovibrio kuenenii TaxID=63658 RepID=UPI0004678336|nr:HEPN domain-containing protein [Hydrogenovibrio kuenenii]
MVSLDIDKILNDIDAKHSRHYIPINAFQSLYEKTENAIHELERLSVSSETKDTILKAHVINTVTAVEVYYRTLIDSIFKTCKPESFEKTLSKLHGSSYKIDDLIAMYKNCIHPLELVASNLNFQSVKNIDKYFSILLQNKFLDEIKSLHYRIKDKPATETQITFKEINDLNYIFNLRHQLIHNPNLKISINEDELLEKIDSINGVVMASDLVVRQFVLKNVDPEIEEKAKK